MIESITPAMVNYYMIGVLSGIALTGICACVMAWKRARRFQ